ncbi:MAG TPA: tol-pal system protein YbgF [Thioalkalivibrio sp.]|nr:tol-pal system protein YbgF [Thioalkalivibrio sp.]
MNKGVRSTLCLGLALALASAPAWADRRTDERLQSLETRMERVDRLMANNALLDLVTRLDAMQDELRQLRGQNEELRHEVETLKSRQRELYLDLDRRIQDAQAPVSAPAPAMGQREPAVPVAASASTQGAGDPAVAQAGERDAYRDAFNLLKDGQYPQAIKAFQGFLARYPQSGYAGNAQYWLGEANYVSKDYPAAVTEFRKVMETYPDSNKVPDARLKLGFTYYELGEWAKARAALEEVKSKHAGSSVARLAEERLARMQREGR